MRIAKQQIMRVAAVLALTAASTSAFAQSADYRRGYEDGFAAAQRGDRDGRDGRGRGGEWGGLRIEQAEYGARGAYCDARRAVRNDIGRRGGAVVASNDLCGDPAIGAPKRLTVIYRCGDDAPQQVSARENDTLRLSCRR
jgi:hypothetical protein